MPAYLVIADWRGVKPPKAYYEMQNNPLLKKVKSGVFITKSYATAESTVTLLTFYGALAMTGVIHELEPPPARRAMFASEHRMNDLIKSTSLNNVAPPINDRVIDMYCPDCSYRFVSISSRDNCPQCGSATVMTRPHNNKPLYSAPRTDMLDYSNGGTLHLWQRYRFSSGLFFPATYHRLASRGATPKKIFAIASLEDKVIIDRMAASATLKEQLDIYVEMTGDVTSAFVILDQIFVGQKLYSDTMFKIRPQNIGMALGLSAGGTHLSYMKNAASSHIDAVPNPLHRPDNLDIFDVFYTARNSSSNLIISIALAYKDYFMLKIKQKAGD